MGSVFIEDINIEQINTGNGKVKGNDPMLRVIVDKELPDIIIVSESYIDIEDTETIHVLRVLIWAFEDSGTSY